MDSMDSDSPSYLCGFVLDERVFTYMNVGGP